MKIRVVIPSYNAQGTIGAAMRSVLDQRGVEVTIVVVDHGSSDLTQSIIVEHASAGQVTLLPLIRQAGEKRSASRPLNAGIGRILNDTADLSQFWFMRLDSDDLLADEDSVRCLLDRSQGKRLVIGRLVFFDEERGTAETYTVAPIHRARRSLLRGAAYSIPHHASLVRLDLLKSVLDRRGFAFDPRLGYGEDLDLTLELISACGADEIAFVDRDVCFKRLSGTTISRTSTLTSIALDHNRVFMRHGLLFGELACRTAADLLLRKFDSLRDSSMRTWLGFPGKRWAAISSIPSDSIVRRIKKVMPLSLGNAHGFSED